MLTAIIATSQIVADPTPSMLANYAEYGALAVLVGALIWTLRTLLTKMLTVIDANTAAMTKLEAALAGKTICPFQDLIEREAERKHRKGD